MIKVGVCFKKLLLLLLNRLLYTKKGEKVFKTLSLTNIKKIKMKMFLKFKKYQTLL